MYTNTVTFSIYVITLHCHTYTLDKKEDKDTVQNGKHNTDLYAQACSDAYPKAVTKHRHILVDLSTLLLPQISETEIQYHCS